MTQRLAQKPDTGVAQGIVGQIELCQRLVDPQGRRKILTSSGSEATAVQPVEDKEWLKNYEEQGRMGGSVG